MADEIAALVTKFNELKNSGNKAYLWLECQDGRSFVTLQVHLQPCEEPQHPHLRRGEAHHVCRGHVQSSRARKAAPSRLRRRELRAAERAACARAACLKIPPSPPHHAPHDISPSPNQQVVDQAAAPEPAHGQGGVPHAHPVPVPCGQQSRHPPPPLPAGNHHPALLPYQEHVPVTGQQAQHSSPPPLREQEHFPPVVPTWPGHYQTSDMAFTPPHPALPLLPPALQAEEVTAAPSFLPPFLPPAELLCQDRHPPLRPLAEQVGEQQHLPDNLLPPAVKAGQSSEQESFPAQQETIHSPVNSPIPLNSPIPSFSFHSHTDSPLHPPPSSSSPRRATLRRIRQKPSAILLKIRKPVRILKTVLNKNIGRGLWTIYHSEGNCEGIVNFVPFGLKCEPVSYIL